MNINFRRLFGFTALAAAAGVAGVLIATPAKADVIYDDVYALTSDHCDPVCGVPNAVFGAVGLKQVGTTVDVQVHLLAGYAYANTGAVDGQAFKFNGTGVTLSDITVDAHTPALQANTGSFNGDGTGPYTFGISCPTCGGGLSSGFTNDIFFEVANATIADLTHSNGTSVFVADVGVTASGTFNMRTGPIDATTPTCLDCTINLTSTPVPEPASLVIFGTALVGLGLFGRRRNRRSKTGAV